MSSAVGGFAEMVWVIEGYDGTTKILDQRIPLNDADETRIASMLRDLASKHLNEAEISAGLADVRKDDQHGRRVTLFAGQDPHYVAGLWRSDELDP